MLFQTKVDCEKAWTVKYRQLETFKKKHGHVNVQSVSESPRNLFRGRQHSSNTAACPHTIQLTSTISLDAAIRLDSTVSANSAILLDSTISVAPTIGGIATQALSWRYLGTD